MGGSNRWSPRQYLTLIAVLAIHAGLLVLLVRASQIRLLRASTNNSVQVVVIAPEQTPRVKIAHLSLRLPNSATAITLGPPVSINPSLPMSASAGGSSDAQGSDVDWRAEARRALRAFDIRSHSASGPKSVSARPEDESWLPSGPHRSGDQYKTPSGDWIVWINANCYQIASSVGATSTSDAEQAQVICRHQPSTLP